MKAAPWTRLREKRKGMWFGAAVAAGVILVLSALGPMVVRQADSSGIAFDESASGHLSITAPEYRLTISKANGALLSISDSRSGAEISQGSNGGCLWGSVFSGSAPYIGGCSYRADRPNAFSYSWDAGTSTLTLRYAGDSRAAQYVDATVTITANSGPFFDLRLALENHAGSTLRSVNFPSELLFKTSAVQSGYLPYYLPGVRVKPAFFTSDHTNVPTYPGGNAFADFVALDIAGSHVAVYSVNGAPNPVQPVALGFIHNAANNVCQEASFCIEHSFQTWVPSGASWTSPIVRTAIGQTVAFAIVSYRRDNGIDGYPSVAAKLGKRFQQYAQAPLIKADAAAVGKPFRSWIPAFSGLPSPSLLHPVAYMPGGHDHSYPDFLPPDPTWGSEKDFAAMIAAAHTKGLLVMPYTNPTWWTDDSRTITHLPSPLKVEDISGLDENKSPVHESYGAPSGYDASPNVPFVRQRLAQAMTLWQTAVPVDCIFEDQIGSRPWLLDLNPGSPSPIAYSQGWLDHTARYAQRCLMTENGWDRLAATEIGFNGSLLTWERAFQDPDQFFGAGNWDAYPLALWLLHDKVLLYQHDLALETMSNAPGVLTWNLAFGIMLSYNWEGSGKNWQSNPWLDLITWMQRDVASQYAGQPLVGYTSLTPHVTQTSFPGLHIIANWQAKRPYGVGGAGIAPGGFLARSDSGSILAGAFTGRFNDQPLSNGTHYILVARTPSQVTVRQPIGADTALTIDLTGKLTARPVHVVAYDQQDHRIGTVHAVARRAKLTFQYRRAMARRAVAYYQVADASGR